MAFAATRAALGGKFWKPLPNNRTRRANDLTKLKQIAEVKAFLDPYKVTQKEKKTVKFFARKLPYFAQNWQYRQCPKLKPADLPPVDMELAKKMAAEHRAQYDNFLKQEYGVDSLPKKYTRLQVVTESIKRVNLEYV
eukprot:TRINITY_DN5017_c0_g1_i3.p1 TRINITY_DN5017_c0_g1~~TRINITY_DN5017_c0_g1_i3.p1  ORF type:complete len:137 (+),score=41.97 TRINITY_DN5017_c0_g1_i3:172-582(+)